MCVSTRTHKYLRVLVKSPSFLVAVFGKNLQDGSLAEKVFKIEICRSLWTHFTDNTFSSYMCTNSIVFLSLIQHSSLLCIILFPLPPNLLFFCPLCNFRAVRSSNTPFLYSASDNPAVHTHLPTCLPPTSAFYPHFPACPSLPAGSCHSPSDGIIPVILSHYRSSDANGCTANPAAGKTGPVPVPALPGSATAVPHSAMPVMHQGSRSSRAGGEVGEPDVKVDITGEGGRLRDIVRTAEERYVLDRRRTEGREALYILHVLKELKILARGGRLGSNLKVTVQRLLRVG